MGSWVASGRTLHSAPQHTSAAGAGGEVAQLISETAALYLPSAACLPLFFLPASACSPLHRGRGVQIVYIYTTRGNFIRRGVWRRGGLVQKKRP